MARTTADGSSGSAADPTGSSPDRAAVHDALRAVLTSDVFRRAPRARDLLSFVVSETLAGRGHLLNERVVSRLALGRPSDVDTRTDASARVQARRTRDLLDRYYAGVGRDDAVRITIPTGQYAAAFVPRQPSRPVVPSVADRAGTRGPAVAVTELRHRSGGVDRRVAAALTESLVQTLSRFPGLQVVGPVQSGVSSSATPDVHDIGSRTGVDFVLHGSVRATHDTVRVTTHLSSATTGTVRWSDTFEHDVDDFVGFGAEDDVLARVAAAIGDFGGVMFREPLAPRSGADAGVVDALRLYYAFLDDLAPVSAEQVVAGLEAAALIEPDNPHVLASLAFTHVVDVLMRGAGAGESMAAAEQCARATLRIEPTNAVANDVLAVVALAQGLHARARKHAEAALDLAPYHPGTAYVAGMVIGAAGEWDRGISIIRRVVRVNPHGPNHRRTLLAVAALMDGDIADAQAEASLLHFPGYVYGPLVSALCLAEADLLSDAEAELSTVLALCPDFLDRPAEILGAAPTIPSHAVDHLVRRIDALVDQLDARRG